MAEPPPGPNLTPERETPARRTLRRSILLVIAVFAGYGVVTTMSERTPGWAKLGAADFPAGFRAARFGDGELAADRPYVIRIKRTGRKRALPPQKMTLSLTEATGASYRCDTRTRCPWIRIAPLTCKLDDEPAGECGFELFEFGRSGVKILPRRRCRLTRPKVRDLNVVCPREVVFGPKTGGKTPAKPPAKPSTNPTAQ